MSVDNKFLISRRAKNKEPYPDTWVCCVGGKAISGETSEETANREMKEEIGKIFPLKKVTSFLYDKPDYRAIFTVFTTTVPVLPKELNPDPREIQFCKAFTIKEILQMISDNPKEFAPTFLADMVAFSEYFK